jgi:hypothetical protein
VTAKVPQVLLNALNATEKVLLWEKYKSHQDFSLKVKCIVLNVKVKEKKWIKTLFARTAKERELIKKKRT